MKGSTMTKNNKTQQTNQSVEEFINSLDDSRVVNDCHELVKLMSDISGHEPKMWGPSIIGFDKYHYKYESGHEGTAPIIGFSPRKGKFALYLGQADQFPELLQKIGNHKTSKACIYIKHLSDINILVLSDLIKKSYAHAKSLYAE